MGQLNTIVYGLPNSCIEAADWLDRLESAAEDSSDKAESARSQATSTWKGPAEDRFEERTDGLSDGIGKIADYASTWSDALRDFASSLRSIINSMEEIKQEAASAGLIVDGPFILPPTPPTFPPQPYGPFTMQEAGPATKKYNDDVAAYNMQVDACNAKVRKFNEIKDKVWDQRKKEDSAHGTLDNELTIDGTDGDDVTNSVTGAATVRSLMGSLENARRLGMDKVQSLNAYGAALQQFMDGKPLDAYAHKVLMDYMDKQAKIGADPEVKVAVQLDKALNTAPASVRNMITSYPGQGYFEGTHGQSRLSIPSEQLGNIARGLPWAGAGLTIFLEARKAERGEQSLGEAVEHSGAQIGGGALGGWIGAAAGGLSGGPLGALGGGLAGGAGGAKFVDDVVTGWNIGQQENKIKNKYWGDTPELQHKSGTIRR